MSAQLEKMHRNGDPGPTGGRPTITTKPRRGPRVLAAFMALATLFSVFSLSQTESPAAADFVCDPGWRLNPLFPEKCTRSSQVVDSKTCPSGSVSIDTNRCSRSTKYCQSGHHLFWGRCHFTFWGKPASYVAYSRTTILAKIVTYRTAFETMPARIRSTIVDSFPPRHLNHSGTCGNHIVGPVTELAGSGWWERWGATQTANKLQIKQSDYIQNLRERRQAGCVGTDHTVYRWHEDIRVSTPGLCKKLTFQTDWTCHTNRQVNPHTERLFTPGW